MAPGEALLTMSPLQRCGRKQIHQLRGGSAWGQEGLGVSGPGRGPSIQMWQTWVRQPVHPAPLGGCEGRRVDLMGWDLARGT